MANKTHDVPALTEEQKQAIFREMQKEQRAAAEQKQADERGITVEQLRAEKNQKSQNSRYTRMAREEYGDGWDDLSRNEQDQLVAEVAARPRKGRSADGERKTLVSVSVPMNLSPDKKRERIVRSIAALQAALATVDAELAQSA